MRVTFKTLLPLLLSWAVVADSHTRELSIPLALDMAVVQQALSQQLSPGQQGAVEIFNDGFNCNTLSLSDPEVAGTEEGYIRVQGNVSARLGTPVGGQCLMPLSWQGKVQTLQEMFVSLDGNSVSFRIIDSNIVSMGDGSAQAPSLVWEWVKAYIHPRLSAVTIELGASLESLQQLLGSAVHAPAAAEAELLSSVRLKEVHPRGDKIDITIILDAPNMAQDGLTEESDAFRDDELARWTAAWQSWDSFATWLIKTMAVPADPALAATLGEILLEARYDLHEALSQQHPGDDPVRELFARTWDRLAPLVRENRIAIPGVEAMQLATFMSAADALQALDSVAPHLGMRFDSNTFRNLARLILPTVTDADLSYDFSVDPFLRTMLGFDPEMEEVDEELGPFGWLIHRAQAATVDPKLVKKLTGWVPARDELDEYLQAVETLLDRVAAAEREKGEVPEGFYPVYETLVLATAWQESCWRQYIDKEGAVQAILSPAGSIGLMQVNRHVWRGIYDSVALRDNIAYNAKAGNEILVHYLVDYALKKKEHVITGKPDSAARAAYAAYNGGPRHLSRYRTPETSQRLKRIDDAFWQKYQAIRKEGYSAVRVCYGS